MWRCSGRNSGCHTGYFPVQTGTKQLGRGELPGHWLARAPNWAAAAAVVVESAVLGKRGTTAVHSRILEWRTVDAAAGCTGHLMAVVLKRGGWHMAEKEGQSSGEQCMGRVLHDAEGDAAAAAVDDCSGSS